MQEAVIHKISGVPDWTLLPILEADNILWTDDFGIRMYQQLCYDDSCLYVRQRAVEKTVRAKNIGLTDSICEDSCMEFFFCPAEGDVRYFNIEINPVGNIYTGFRQNRTDSVRLLVPHVTERFDIRSSLTEDGWVLSYRVPLDFIRLFFPDYSFQSGHVIMANFYKCGDLTPNPHFLSWNPVTSETPDFHRPCDFGRLILE